MAGVQDAALIKLPSQLGINNLAQETNLKPGELREAVNVDLQREEDAQPKRRSGYTKIISGTAVHSLFRKRQFPYALYVDGSTMYAFALGDPPFVVRTGMALRDVSYELVNDRVYWSNNQQTGIVYPDGSSSDWGVESPAGQPALAVTTPGDLPAGTYQVAITFRDMRGEESGARQAATITVPDGGGGIVLSAVPQPVSSNVAFVRVYVTAPNGVVLYQARDMPVGMTTATIGLGTRGIPLATQFLEPLPPGQFVRYYNGRIYIVSGAYLRWSESLRYGLYHPVNNQIRIGAGITLCEPVADGADGGGIFVADGKRTYFLSGNDPATFSRPIVHQYGATAGTGISVPGSVFGIETTAPVAYWLDTQGVAILGLPNGQIMPLRHDAVVAPAAMSGASLYREVDGMRQVITTLGSATPRGFAVADRAVATVYRNGVSV